MTMKEYITNTHFGLCEQNSFTNKKSVYIIDNSHKQETKLSEDLEKFLNREEQNFYASR